MTDLTLRSGVTELRLSPAFGASILSFTHGGQNMFKPAEPEWARDRDPRQTSYFPLVPYSNRIRDGRFIFQGRAVDLNVQLKGGDIAHEHEHAHALHGVGWTRPWRVARQSSAQCICVLDHNAGRWPWGFTARQTLTLSSGRLRLDLDITNKSPHDMPAGLGAHPYFPDKALAHLRFDADGLWQAGDDGLPTAWQEKTDAVDFAARSLERKNFLGKALKDVTLDHCFTGFGGQADIGWTGIRYGLSVRACQPLQWAVVYVPGDHDYFCFEPVSHMNNAHNWTDHLAGTGLRTLSFGETLSVSIEFVVTESGNTSQGGRKTS